MTVVYRSTCYLVKSPRSHQETSISSQAPGYYVLTNNFYNINHPKTLSIYIYSPVWIFKGYTTPPRLTTQNIFEGTRKSFKLTEFLGQRMSTKLSNKYLELSLLKSRKTRLSSKAQSFFWVDKEVPGPEPILPPSPLKPGRRGSLQL